MKLFKNKMFGSYYPKEIRGRENVYNYLRMLYINRVIQIVAMSLLEIDYTADEGVLLVETESGVGLQTYTFSPHNMNGDSLNVDAINMNNLTEIIKEEAKKKLPSKEIKKADSFDEIVENLLGEIGKNERFSDDYYKMMKRGMFARAKDVVMKARGREFLQDKDIILCAAHNVIHTLHYSDGRINAPGKNEVDKLINMCDRFLAAEFTLYGGLRFSEWRNFLGDCDEGEVAEPRFWAYVNQMTRLAEAGDIWR